jgi:hypothetical protein
LHSALAEVLCSTPFGMTSNSPFFTETSWLRKWITIIMGRGSGTNTLGSSIAEPINQCNEVNRVCWNGPESLCPPVTLNMHGGGSWSRIQKNPHGDACRTHGNRPGWTQDAGSRVAFGKNRAGQKPAWVDCQKKRSRERLIP